MKEATKLNILYSPVNVLLHAIALLPYCVLYRIADFLYFIIYYVAQYRVKIVKKNIYDSFPEKSDKEKNKIIKDFYLHFADYFVETIKLLHISDSHMRHHMVFKNMDIVDKRLDQGRSAIIYAGHYANWEYLPSITLWTRHDIEDCVFAQIYRPLRNKWFDTFFLKLRSRFNSQSFAMRNSLRDLIRLRQNGKQSITGFISDQHPRGNDSNHVIRFLNHDTAFITGSETLARKLDFDTFYFDIEKVKRGYYTVTIRQIALNPGEVKPMTITNTYASMLETSIRRNPSLWLWTHNRWKHKATIQPPHIS